MLAEAAVLSTAISHTMYLQDGIKSQVILFQTQVSQILEGCTERFTVKDGNTGCDAI